MTLAALEKIDRTGGTALRRSAVAFAERSGKNLGPTPKGVVDKVAASTEAVASFKRKYLAKLNSKLDAPLCEHGSMKGLCKHGC